jgi:phosphoserine phosphatase RsbU/P
MFTVLLVITIGVVDYITTKEITLYLFYVLPVFISCWRLGLWQGIVISLLALAFLCVDDFYNRPEARDIITLASYWNVIFQFIFFVILVLLLISLRNAIKRINKAKREKAETEMRVAREVQQNLFPQQMHTVQGIEYHGLCIPADEIGGDYYDYIKLNHDETGFAVGDTTGHNLSSALLMASLLSFVRSHAIICKDDLKQLLYQVNNHICDSTLPGHYATIFYGVYNNSDSSFRYVNAGHNPPIIFRKQNDTYEVLNGGGLMIGIKQMFEYNEMQLTIEKEDVLLLYTDGITDTFDKNNTLYGEERLISLVKNNLHLSTKELCNEITKDVYKYSGGRKQADDMSLLIIKGL